MKQTTVGPVHHVLTEVKILFRQFCAVAVVAGISIFTTGCPAGIQTVAQLRAREAKLNRELTAAAKREDLSEFWKINRELNDIKDAYRQHYGEDTSPQAGRVLARYPEPLDLHRPSLPSVPSVPSLPAATSVPTMPAAVPSHPH